LSYRVISGLCLSFFDLGSSGSALLVHTSTSTRKPTMKLKLALGLLLCVAATVAAQRPSSSFDRGHSQQAWQNSGFAALIAKCKTPPKPFAIGGGQATPANPAPPPAPALPKPDAIPGVIAAGQSWKVVWSWEGNNADGPISGDNGTILFANND